MPFGNDRQDAARLSGAVGGRDRPLRVLIVRIGALGDVLHAMPAVAALRERMPGVFLAWAIEPRWSELLQAGAGSEGVAPGVLGEARPLVDMVCSVPTNRWRRQWFSASTVVEIRALRGGLRSSGFDVCVDLQGSIKSAALGRMAGATLFAGPADPREREARWFYQRAIPTGEEHVVEQACEMLGAAVGQAMGVTTLEAALRPAVVRLPVDEAAERWSDAALAEAAASGGRWVMIAPAAGWGAKQWPAERFGAVAARLAGAGFQVVVNAASAGDKVSLRVVEASGGRARRLACSVGQLVALVRRCSLMIAGDTGPLHLAAALRKPVVALFGPTDPARTGPYGSRSVILRNTSSAVDHRRTLETEPGLQQIEVDAVVEAALGLLQEGQDKLEAVSETA